MRKLMTKGALLAGVLAITMTAVAQHAPAGMRNRTLGTDIAVLAILEHAQVAQVNGHRFWPFGLSAEGGVTFWNGLGVAADVTGEHAMDISNKVGLDKISLMAGPRYTFDVLRPGNSFEQAHRTRAFAEVLFGHVHAFNSVFPGPTAVTSSAGSFSMQAGGGLDIALDHGFGIRAFQADWVRTTLPNNASNVQNDFRIGFGASYRR
jgi:hypothetical protein